MENNRNFFITIALSVLILTLWQVFYMNPQHRERARGRRDRGRNGVEQQKKAEPAQPGGCRNRAASPRPQARSRRVPGTDGDAAGRAASGASPATQRVKIDTPSLVGSINLTGARIDDIRLKALPRDGREELADHRTAQSRMALPNGYFAEIGFVGNDATGAVPGAGHGLDRRGQPDADARRRPSRSPTPTTRA